LGARALIASSLLRRFLATSVWWPDIVEQRASSIEMGGYRRNKEGGEPEMLSSRIISDFAV
jgi:hypothetical protein